MKTKNILVVENEQITAARICSCLEAENYSTTTATTGEEAIELCHTHIYDAILMDIHLDGKIDGITAARSIAKMYTVPLIFLTELTGKNIFESASETYPQSYLTKPFDNGTLQRALAIALKNAERPAADEPEPQMKIFPDGVFVPDVHGSYHKLLFSDILYVKAKQAYSEIYYEADNGGNVNHYTVSLSSNRVIDQLALPQLVKVHRSYHVNVQKIEGYNKAESTIIIRRTHIPITPEYIDSLKKQLLFFRF